MVMLRAAGQLPPNAVRAAGRTMPLPCPLRKGEGTQKIALTLTLSQRARGHALTLTLSQRVRGQTSETPLGFAAGFACPLPNVAAEAATLGCHI